MLRNFLLTLIFLSVNASAALASYTVSPVTLSVEPDQHVSSLTVRNTGDSPKTLQIEALSWHQTHGKDIYEKTKDIIITPMIFTIEPGKSQLIRVAPRNRGEGHDELTYRLFIKEVYRNKPQVKDQGINMLLNINIPLFVMPAETQLVPLQCQYRLINIGTLEVSCTNNNNVHQFINKVLVPNKYGKAIEMETFQYILAGHKAEIKKHGNFSNLGKVQISFLINNEAKIIDVPLHQ